VFDQSGQIHDFNPGIAADGRFWTIPMDPRSVDVHPESGRAVYQARHLAMPDYHDFGSAVSGVPPDPGTVSFRIEWAPSRDKHHYRYAPHKWEGRFVHTTATCSWSGRTEFATFSTKTNKPTIFAEVGRERSGVFFGHEDDDRDGALFS
jgi:hypothetical protein